MKKYIMIILAAILMVSFLSACGKMDEAVKAADSVSKKNGDQLSIVTTIFPEYDWVKNILGADSELSSTLVYSEVYNMMVNSEEYCGKRIKMSGIMAYYHDEQTGNDYFSCIIQDATACCAQGIEFELTKDYVYPQDYPEVGTVITVIGIFDTYWEGEYEYCTLRNAKLL